MLSVKSERKLPFFDLGKNYKPNLAAEKVRYNRFVFNFFFLPIYYLTNFLPILNLKIEFTPPYREKKTLYFFLETRPLLGHFFKKGFFSPLKCQTHVQIF